MSERAKEAPRLSRCGGTAAGNGLPAKIYFLHLFDGRRIFQAVAEALIVISFLRLFKPAERERLRTNAGDASVRRVSKEGCKR